MKITLMIMRLVFLLWILITVVITGCNSTFTTITITATPLQTEAIIPEDTPTIKSSLHPIYIIQAGDIAMEDKEYFVKPGDEIPDHLIDKEVFQNEIEKMQVILKMVVNEGTISKEDVRIEIWVSEDGKSAESFLETLIDLPDLPKGSWIGYPIISIEPTDSP